MVEWATLLRAAAEHPNVSAKVSGLNTMLAAQGWAASDLRPAVEVAYECFGPDRLMCGSDWPVSLLNGDYAKVWSETVAAITAVAGDSDTRRILEDTPARLYRLDEDVPGMSTASAGDDRGRSH
jgi:L-fuconolactonase